MAPRPTNPDPRPSTRVPAPDGGAGLPGRRSELRLDPTRSARRGRGLVLGLGAVVLLGGVAAWWLMSRGIQVHGFEEIARFPHDPNAYTQGLLIDQGQLFESTGRHGQSGVRRVTLETGVVEQQNELPYAYFGEGLALLEGHLYQLTWHAGVCRVYNRDTLAFVRQMNYEGEGWGLTTDGTHLIQSDGTDRLSFRDPQTFREVRRIRVRAEEEPVVEINELEWVQGEIYANVWKQDRIARIDPKSGAVLGWIDLTGLFDTSDLEDPDSVLNGIAYEAATGRLFVTGKLWPYLFEIRVR